jgi:pimeloyl-ACP methyl ester carboxylesterase
MDDFVTVHELNYNRLPRFMPENIHPELAYLDHAGQRLAYRQVVGKGPGLFFLSGFRSDMTGSKAEYLDQLACEQGLAFTRFDYTGHGQSSGTLRDGDIERWQDDALAMFDQLTTGPQILVGSSMGGWLALLLAQARPERVHALIGLAAAPDFTEDLMWPAMTPAQQTELMEKGEIAVPTEYDPEPYLITRRLIESGRRQLLLRAPLEISCPVRLLQGMQDQDVPWQRALQLAEVLTGDDVQVTLIKDGGHRLSRENDLEALRVMIETII